MTNIKAAKINCGRQTVSVIIPCYNGAAFLTDAIESVLAQTYRYFEIIFVDDGSSDNTRSLAINYPVKYIYQQNSGVVVARNRGINAASGNFLVFLDADDMLLPNALEIGVDSICTHSQSGFVAGSYQEIDRDGSIISQPESQPAKTANYQMLLRGEAFVPPSTLMFQKTAVTFTGGFDTDYAKGAEDYALYLQIARQFPIYIHNKTIVKYRRHDDNASNNAINMLEGCLRTLDSNWIYIKGDPEYERAYQIGKQHWIDLFGPYLIYQLIDYVKSQKWIEASKALVFQLKVYPQGISYYVLNYFTKKTLKL